jgi:hypothetical protein
MRSAPKASTDSSATAKAPAGRAAPKQRATKASGSAAAKSPGEAKAKSPGEDPAKPREAKAKPRARSAPGRAARPQATAPEPVPRQGFESEGDRASGPVQPPGGAELLATAAEIVSELAKAGMSAGERLVKDVLSRLPLS